MDGTVCLVFIGFHQIMEYEQHRQSTIVVAEIADYRFHVAFSYAQYHFLKFKIPGNRPRMTPKQDTIVYLKLLCCKSY